MRNLKNNLYVCNVKFNYRRQVICPSVACRAFFMPANVHDSIRRLTPCGIGNDRKPLVLGLDSGKWAPFFQPHVKNNTV
jgi:hypothetical protein